MDIVIPKCIRIFILIERSFDDADDNDDDERRNEQTNQRFKIDRARLSLWYSIDQQWDHGIQHTGWLPELKSEE